MWALSGSFFQEQWINILMVCSNWTNLSFQMQCLVCCKVDSCAYRLMLLTFYLFYYAIYFLTFSAIFMKLKVIIFTSSYLSWKEVRQTMGP